PVAEAIRATRRAPFVVFGHSLGALLAFELTRRLRRIGSPLPQALLVSGRCAPQLRPNVPLISHLDRAQLVERAAQLFGGITQEVLENHELMELMAEALKADMRISEEYQYVEEEPLECPIAAFGGDRDPCVSQRELELWREQSRGGFMRDRFPGDHFYFREEQNELRLLGNIERISSRIFDKRDVCG
ncbi:MAG: thioesterase, partial [Acidobacteria bacterium]|nr:thioesterase [Acidobacteriota bacterium]